ncbi:MAG: transketolase [Desulfurivibrionaceae bacterium]
MAASAEIEKLKKLARLIRYYILTVTTKAGSGHPTTALSATDLMTGLLFGGSFHYDTDQPAAPNNDRLIFSKGHASPLFYSLWLAAGQITEKEMMTYRKFGSRLEGHPTSTFPYTEAATGSLGQGLAIGLGMALNGKYLDKISYRTYVLLGDSEMTEGEQWEAVQLAAYYKLDNLIGILDVNRLGQRGETMYGHHTEAYRERLDSFGWETMVIDGHSFTEILSAYEKALNIKDRPVMIIARTLKGKGVSLVEDKEGWHGKPLSEDECKKAISELGEIDRSVRGNIPGPEDLKPEQKKADKAGSLTYSSEDKVATRKAFGFALSRIFPQYPDLISLDGEVSNSTGAEIFKNDFPDNFFEMFVAEQAMLGAALGLALRGKLVFVSTFAAFLSRAYDQIRMSQYCDANLKLVGSHAGVSIGEDGPSQMGLEDIAMFRAVLDSVVLYPADAVTMEKCVEEAADHRGIVYIRATRAATPVIYSPEESFPIGGSKILRKSDKDQFTVAAAGITVFEALAAYDQLREVGVFIRVVDLYSVKPLDRNTLLEAASSTRSVLTVEDHYEAGGLGEAVMSALADQEVPVYSLAVRKKPKSGRPDELLDYEDISSRAIVDKIKELL